MRDAFKPTPIASRGSAPYTRMGICHECGRYVVIRHCDGMIRKHVDDLGTGLLCEGVGKAPSKIKPPKPPLWAPARRSN